MNTTASLVPRYAPKILLMGDPGSGKTHSAALLSDHGITVRFIFTEPGFDTLESMPEKYRARLGKEIDYCYIAPANMSFDMLLDTAQKINQLSFQALASLPEGDRRKFTEFQNILRAFANYKSDITGQEYGSVDSWGENCCYVLDSLAGVGMAAMTNANGMRPIPGMPGYQTAMSLEENLIKKLTLGTPCWGIVNSHMERERDEVAGVDKIYPTALGKKNAPKMGRYFSEVIQTNRDLTGKFTWNTKHAQAVLKNRALPYGEGLVPDFAPIVRKFREASTANSRPAAPQSP